MTHQAHKLDEEGQCVWLPKTTKNKIPVREIKREREREREGERERDREIERERERETEQWRMMVEQKEEYVLNNGQIDHLCSWTKKDTITSHTANTHHWSLLDTKPCNITLTTHNTTAAPHLPHEG